MKYYSKQKHGADQHGGNVFIRVEVMQTTNVV